MSDELEKKKRLPVVVKPPAVIYRISCGDGPCKVMRIVAGTGRRVDEPTELPAPKNEDEQS